LDTHWAVRERNYPFNYSTKCDVEIRNTEWFLPVCGGQGVAGIYEFLK